MPSIIDSDIPVKSNTSPYSTDDPGYIQRVRDLYRTAIKVNKFHSATWVAWAKFEERLGNLGIPAIIHDVRSFILS